MPATDRRKARIAREEILDLGDYERARDEIRVRAIAARGLRRVTLGPNATIAFENRETVLYQIQEMLRAERIAKEGEVQHEIDTYADLLPSPNELSATMMFEFPLADERSVRLADLVGFENHLRLDFAGAGSAAAYFDRRQIDSDKLSAVQFIRFALEDDQVQALASSAVRIVADHPRYRHTAEISPPTRQALATDLADTAVEVADV